MNHRANSVVRHVVEGDECRASYSFSQPVYSVEFLLQRWASVTQDMEAAEVKAAENRV